MIVNQWYEYRENYLIIIIIKESVVCNHIINNKFICNLTNEMHIWLRYKIVWSGNFLKNKIGCDMNN